MKKLNLIVLIGIAFLMMTNLLYAQEKAARVGIGVSLGKQIFGIDDGAALTLFDFPSICIPIITSPKFRLVPEIGLYRYSRSTDGSDYSYMILSMGCGIFPMIQKGNGYIYYGGRLGLVRMSYSNENDDDSKIDFYIGPAIGGEYFFTDHLSLGGEAQLNYTFMGQFEYDDDVSESLISSKTLIFVRWYF